MTFIPSVIAVSPHYTQGQIPSPTPLEIIVDIFADRVRGWQLDIAQELRPTPHSGFAVLAIVASYFEMYSKFEAGYPGAGAVKRHFEAGVRSVLEPHLGSPANTLPPTVIEILYTEIRCGMYHDAMTGPSVIISDAPGIPVIQLDAGRVIIDPHQLVGVLQDHFSRYVLKLKSESEVRLRTNFAKRWHKTPGKPLA